jgi:hypothetical protein
VAVMGSPNGAEEVIPDTKDWTWTLQRPCPECGFDARQVTPAEIAGQTLTLAAPWATVLRRSDVRDRPAPRVWSPLEYGCHVRDVCRVFEGRVRLMLAKDAPEFENWDQDAAAVADRYHQQDPAVVSAELSAASAVTAAVFAGVGVDQWQRTGLRGNGSQFTVHSLGQYFLHDLTHHLVDVRAQRAGGGRHTPRIGADRP